MSFSDPELFEQAGTSIRKAVETLNSCITKMVDALQSEEEKDYDQPTVIHLTWLTHQVIQIVAELKLLENGPAKRTGSSLSERLKK